jgi:hypothetical protein
MPRILGRMAALILSLLAAGGEPNAALIWGGGPARADADRWFSAYNEAMKPYDGLQTLKPGYPRIVESAQVPGLKPGFFVVLLGICPLGDALPRTRWFKTIYAGAYFRKVSVDASSCPELAKGTSVEHTQSLTADNAVLTMSEVQTPRGGVLRATLISRSGALIDSEGFDTPRRGHVACVGGFRKEQNAFEVTLCDSTKDTNTCCAAKHLEKLSTAKGKLLRGEQVAEEPAREEEKPDCTSERVTGHFSGPKASEAFSLVTCEEGSFEQGEGMVEHHMSATLHLEREGKRAGELDLGSWTNGWEWGGSYKLLGALPLGKTGTAAIVVTSHSYGEGPGIDSESDEAFAYDAELSKLWETSANQLSVGFSTGGLSVSARQHVDWNGESEVVSSDPFGVVWKNGALVETRP